MFALERYSVILSLLDQQQRVTVLDLSRQMGITAETVRRDLKVLEDKQLLTRTHGGAVSVNSRESERPSNVRQGINRREKEIIASIACKLIHTGDTIILDSSTSACYIAKEIKKMSHLTVVTNSLDVLNELSDCEQLQVITTGGTIRHPNLSFIGSITERALEGCYGNTTFLSCRGLSPEIGMLDNSEQESQVRRMMIRHSAQTVLLCDSSKFEKSGTYIVDTLDHINMIISDKPCPGRWSKRIREAGVEWKSPDA